MSNLFDWRILWLVYMNDRYAKSETINIALAIEILFYFFFFFLLIDIQVFENLFE